MPITTATRAAALVTGAVVATLPAVAQETFTVTGSQGTELAAEAVAAYESAWAMTFLPDGRMLITEKGGDLVLASPEGRPIGEIEGVPRTAVVGQGGLGDVVLHPDFAENGLVYLSLVEEGPGGYGGIVVRGRLGLDEDGGRLGDVERIWEQAPKASGGRHFALRMAFGPDGMLYITSGDRGGQTPAQDISGNLGKILRLAPDGSPPQENPWADEGGVAPEFWTIGHRNPLGIDFAPDGTLWSNEMGPRGGDELNLIQPGENYGWPVVSEGINYSMIPIPDHDTRPEFVPPVRAWVPSISPAGLVIYDGALFPEWQGDAVMGALSGQALVVASLSDGVFVGEERFGWDARIREVEEGPGGALWVLEDGDGGRLIRLVPAD